MYHAKILYVSFSKDPEGLIFIIMKKIVHLFHLFIRFILYSFVSAHLQNVLDFSKANICIVKSKYKVHDQVQVHANYKCLP